MKTQADNIGLQFEVLFWVSQGQTMGQMHTLDKQQTDQSVTTNVVRKAACLFLGHPDSRNNHTETVLFKSLVSQSLNCIASQLFHLELTNFQYFVFYNEVCGLPSRFQHVYLWRQPHGFSLTPLHFLSPSIQLSFSCLTKFSLALDQASFFIH